MKRHYRVGWSLTTVCGRNPRDGFVTRDPSRVDCERCRAAILRMARSWEGVVALGKVQP